MKSVVRPRPGWIAALCIGLLLELYIPWLDVVAFENAEEPEGDQIAKRPEPRAPPLV